MTYRVAWDGDHSRLVWLVHRRGRWWGPLRDGGFMVVTQTALARATSKLDPKLPRWERLRHLAPVLGREAERLTGLKMPAAMDFLMEQNLDHPAVANHDPAAVVPPRAAAAAERTRHARAKVAEWEAKARRVETFLKKWRRRLARAERVTND